MSSDSDKDSAPGWVERIANRLGELMALQEERVRSQIAAGLVETRNALRLQGARSEPLNGSRLLWGGSGRLVGWSLRATGGAVAVTLHDGRPETLGDVLAVIDLAAGQSATVGLPGSGVSVTEACSAVVTGAGTVSGAVFLGAKD